MKPSDWILLVFSLLLALLVSLTHSLSQRFTHPVDVPFTLESNIEGHSKASSNVQTASLRVTATGFNILKINRLANKNESIYLDAANLKASGNNTYSFSTKNEAFISALKNLIGEKARIEVFHTDSLRFHFPTEYCKKVEVQPIHTISYENQYMSTRGLEIQPDSILIYGDSARLASVYSINTKPIKLSKLSHTKYGSIPLVGQLGIRYQTNSVKYSVDVTRFIEIPQEVEVEGINVPDYIKFSIYPSTAILYIRCENPIRNRDFSGLKLVVDYNKYMSAHTNKCVGEILGAENIDGLISVSSSVEIFDCLSQTKQ